MEKPLRVEDLPPAERAAFDMAAALGEIIQHAGQVPAGLLYAELCGHMTVGTFENLIDALVHVGVVRRDASHLLTWIGPQIKES